MEVKIDESAELLGNNTRLRNLEAQMKIIMRK